MLFVLLLSDDNRFRGDGNNSDNLFSRFCSFCLCCLWNVKTFSKMTGPLTISEQAKIAAGNEVRNFIVLVQRRSGVCKGRHETLRPEVVMQSL